MKKLLAMIVILLALSTLSMFAQDDTTMSKNEWLVTKNSGSYPNQMEEYALYCRVTYNKQFQPEDYHFVFRAQNDRYEVLEERFIIYSGDAQGMYDTLSSCLFFSKNNRESGLTFTTGDISMTNYNLKLFGWKTEIKIGSEYHSFSEKDFKKMLKKFDEFCKKQNITINKAETK